MRKNEKGMTLVALLVTIIVLLILAGITISLTIANGGLINKTKKSVTVYNSSVQNETTTLNESENLVESVMLELDQ